MGEKLPPNSTLIFDVTLLGFHEKNKEKWDYTAEERMEFSIKWKEEGNVYFKAQDYQNSIKSYKKVTEFLEMDMKDSQEARNLRVSCLSNCALVYFKMGEHKQAIEYSDMVLKNDSNNVKAIFRKGQSHL